MTGIRVRDSSPPEIERIVDYFHDADHGFLRGMGVDPARLPGRSDWIETITREMALPVPERSVHFLTWLIDGTPAGHSNVNKILSGKEAYMHLHVWSPGQRQRGHGTELVRLSAARFCELFELDDLFCEPYVHNPAPNRALEKAGFTFVKTHEPAPGYINFPQELNRWHWRCLRPGD